MLPEDPETTILKRLKKPKPEDQESDAPGQKSDSGAPATTTGTRGQ
jgi:membrane protein required for colicin V production